MECRENGTLRLSALPNQMRRIQINASVAECDGHVVRGGEMTGQPAGARVICVTATATGNATVFCCCEPEIASGGAGTSVLFCDVAQQVLFAQQSPEHAFSLGAFDNTQAGAGSRMGTTSIAAASINGIVVLLDIGCSNSMKNAPRLEKQGRN
jgi:hypothetical protein